MANRDIPFGFRPYQEMKRLRKYVAAGTTDIFKGDIVQMKSNGTIRTIVTTTGANTIIGVAASFNDASAGNLESWVYDHPDQLYTCQDDGDSATPAQTNLGNTAPVILTAGNTTTGQGKQELDISAAATGTADPLKIVDFVVGPGRAIGKNATIVVKLQKHLYNERTAV
jgi:hypothetical protein